MLKKKSNKQRLPLSTGKEGCGGRGSQIEVIHFCSAVIGLNFHYRQGKLRYRSLSIRWSGLDHSLPFLSLVFSHLGMQMPYPLPSTAGVTMSIPREIVTFIMTQLSAETVSQSEAYISDNRTYHIAIPSSLPTTTPAISTAHSPPPFHTPPRYTYQVLYRC